MAEKKSLRKDVEKMKNNGESSLKVKNFIAIFLILVTLGANIQLFTLNNVKLAKVDTKEDNNGVEEQLVVAQSVQTITQERNVETTTRFSEERTTKETIQEEQPKYISIEEITISRDMDLSKKCGISKEDFINLMANMKVDYSGFFAENAEAIYDICEEYEINEIFFCGLIAAESGWSIASNHRNTCNYISMMSGGKLIRYSTPAEGLEAAAKLLHNRYLTEGGSYYSGKTLSGVQKRFCPNSSTWVGLVYGCMKQVIK